MSRSSTAAIRALQADSVEANLLREKQETLQIWTQARDTTFAALSSLVLQQLDLQQNLLAAQLDVWKAENAQPTFENLRRFAGMFVVEVAAARAGKSMVRSEAFRRLVGDIQP